MKPTKSDDNAQGGFIRRGRYTQKFTVLPNTLLQEKPIKLADIGLVASISSRPEDWTCRVAGSDLPFQPR